MRLRLLAAAALLIAAACSRETAAPEQQTAPPPPPSTSAAPPPPVATRTGGSYEGAMTWLRSAPGFDFTIDEKGVHAEGTMTRPTVGAEVVEFRSESADWRGSAGPQGVTWEKKDGGRWTAAEPPPFANRLYQRVTVAFDPQKKEGDAQMVETAGDTKRYRFTNANTGDVHEVVVSLADDSVRRITIAGVMDLQIRPHAAKPVS